MNKIKKIISLLVVSLSIILYQNCTPFEVASDGSSVSEMNYFSGLFDKVIAPNCLVCHSGTSPSGDTDLSTHASIMASDKVVIGDSMASALFRAVSNPLIPEHDVLKETQLMALAEWIDGGARENETPTVSAGADKTIRLPLNSVSLDGRASDIDGTIVSYLWSQTSGPNSAVLSNQNTRALTASGLVSGNYIFTFRATDDKGASSTDTVAVNVVAANNVLPIVELGANRNITLPTNSVTITSTASDSDGSIVNYLWTQAFGPSDATLSGASTGTLMASGLIEGSYIFRLEVTDNSGSKANDTVTVTVSAMAPTYSLIRDEIFISSCVGCHSGTRPSGGYNMSTYSGVMTEVTTGNASQSQLYRRVQDGSMPPGGGLSTLDRNRIRDWINAGALNN